MSGINIRQVAKVAGVSTATVSRVINGTGPVKQETREKVMRVVEQEGFHPNLLGQRLRNSQSGMLLVLVSSLANPYCAQVVCGIEHEAERLGYHILLCNSESNPEREMAYLKLLQGKVVDGVITMQAATRTSALKALIGNRPWVQCVEYEQGAAPFVSIDNYAAARQAVDHLIALGRQRIGMISTSEDFGYRHDRERAYRDSLLAAGRSFSRVATVECVASFADGASGYASLSAEAPGCDAIFALSDMLACGALSAAVRDGKRVPEDLAIIGFDGLPYGEITLPALSTVQQPMHDIGMHSARLLVAQITGEPLSDQQASRLLPCTLLPRGSTLAREA